MCIKLFWERDFIDLYKSSFLKPEIRIYTTRNERGRPSGFLPSRLHEESHLESVIFDANEGIIMRTRDCSSAQAGRCCLFLVVNYLLVNCVWTQISVDNGLTQYILSRGKEVTVNRERRRRSAENQTTSDEEIKVSEAVSSSILRTVSKKCNCGTVGHSSVKYRIVGGAEAHPHSKPWMAAIVYRKNFYHFCGGTIINNQFILTAAHCVYRTRLSSILVVVGLHDKFDAQELRSGAYGIHNVIIHSGYNPVTVDNDIALIELDEPIHFSDTISPACLPQQNTDFTGVNGVVSGWGAVEDCHPSGSECDQETSQMLQEVTLPVISTRECRRKITAGKITDNMMCAGYPEGGHDACQGDSGGPMVYPIHGRWFIVGVVSWGDGCAQPNRPGVYTNVTRYINWIYSNTQSGVFCW